MEFALCWDGEKVVIYEVLSGDLDIVAYIEPPNNRLDFLKFTDDSTKQYARNFLTNIKYTYTE